MLWVIKGPAFEETSVLENSCSEAEGSAKDNEEVSLKLEERGVLEVEEAVWVSEEALDEADELDDAVALEESAVLEAPVKLELEIEIDVGTIEAFAGDSWPALGTAA